MFIGQSRNKDFVTVQHANKLNNIINENPLHSIWNHLVKITKEEGVTVIITTHYIEEAKQSDRVNVINKF